jgi:hypothetical protein
VRVSPLLQTALVALVAGGLLALPWMSSVAGETVAGGAGVQVWLRWAPPLWFLGLYEWILGTENPVLIGLAQIAAVSVVAVLAVALAVYPLAYRRLMVASVEDGPYRHSTAGSLIARLIAAATSRNAQVIAVAEFFLATIARVDRHRFVMAGSIGLAIAWGAASLVDLRSGMPGSPDTSLLAVPLSTLVFVLAGMRVAAGIPSSLAPVWMFEVVTPTPRQARAALERTMMIAVVLPVVAGSSVLVAWWWEVLPLPYAAMVSAVGYLLVEVAVWRLAMCHAHSLERQSVRISANGGRCILPASRRRPAAWPQSRGCS